MPLSNDIFRGSYGPSRTGASKTKKFQDLENRVLEMEVRYKDLQCKRRGKKTLAQMRELVENLAEVKSMLKEEIKTARGKLHKEYNQYFQDKEEFIIKFFSSYNPTADNKEKLNP